MSRRSSSLSAHWSIWNFQAKSSRNCAHVTACMAFTTLFFYILYFTSPPHRTGAAPLLTQTSHELHKLSSRALYIYTFYFIFLFQFSSSIFLSLLYFLAFRVVCLFVMDFSTVFPFLFWLAVVKREWSRRFYRREGAKAQRTRVGEIISLLIHLGHRAELFVCHVKHTHFPVCTTSEAPSATEMCQFRCNRKY